MRKNENKKLCDKCGQEYGLRNYQSHTNACNGIPKKNSLPKYQLINEKFTCICCNFIGNTRQQVTSHWWRNHTPDGLQHSGGGASIGNIPWNKGLYKETNSVIMEASKKISSTLKEGYASGRLISTQTSLEARAATSRRMSLHNPGGKSKWFEVAGQKCQGTWERNIALKFEELSIKWTKLKTNKDVLEYVMDGMTKCYTPDFYLPDYDIFLEVKGYWWGRDREKMDIVLNTYPDKKIVIIEKELYHRILDGEQVWLL